MAHLWWIPTRRIYHNSSARRWISRSVTTSRSRNKRSLEDLYILWQDINFQ